MNLLKSARDYIKKGICVIATNKDKRAFLPWTEYQNRLITESELEEQFNHPQAEALAVVCGKCSGNLEVIDIDSKYDLTGKLFDSYLKLIKENNDELHSKLYIVTTRGKGYHLYIRCDTIQGNQKLANRETNEKEKEANPKDRVRVLIETRGQAGYVLAPPSEGYKIIQGKSIPLLSSSERDLLLELARSFNQIIAKPSTNHISKGYNPKDYGMSPFDDYNNRADVVQLLVNHGWTFIKENSERWYMRRPGRDEGTSGDVQKNNKWFSVFSTSTEFEPNKAYLPYAVYAQLECNGDFKLAARKLLDQGYGEKREYFGDKMEKELYKRKRDGEKKEDIIQFISTKYKKGDAEAKDIFEKLEKIWGESLCVFWDFDERGNLKINHTKFVEFLHYNGGYSLYFYDEKSTIFRMVRELDGFVEEVSSEHMKKFVKDYIDSLPDTFDGGITPDELKELVIRGAGIYFNQTLLEFMNRSRFDFLRDTDKECYLPFRNGVIHISKEKIELMSYKQINKVIWKSQVIPYDILIEDEMDLTLVEYSKFVRLISGDKQGQYEYALTLIGYLLHQFKDPTKPYAVVLAEETEDENKGGGTGKGIFIKAISKLIQVERIDGKNFKLDKSFAFQRVGLDTDLICIEDVRRNVDFEGFYSIITEGITVERKNKDELFIPYEESPKIVFTTNYTVPSIGNHGKRRQRVFEFSNFFGPTMSPEDYFKHKLFNDWDKDEWNRFFNMMFLCMRLYLENGLLSTEGSLSIKRKQIRTSFTEEFLEWMDNHIEKHNNEYCSTTEMYKNFLEVNDFNSKDYTIQRFKRAVKTSCDVFGFSMDERRSKTHQNRRETRIHYSKGSAEKKPELITDSKRPF